MDEARPDSNEHSSGLSRRQLIKRGAVVGGAAVWIPPVIQSLRLPAMAQTGSPAPALRDCGWMTGGGSIRSVNGLRVNYGFELHCQIRTFPPNNFEINWRQAGTWRRFNLTSLVSPLCSDTPGVDAGPNANFDTLRGSGPGFVTIGGVAEAATAEFALLDAGEPGAATNGFDHIDLVIRNASGGVLLEVHGYPDGGNLQAHTAFGQRRC